MSKHFVLQIKIFFNTSFDKKATNPLPFSHKQISPQQDSSFCNKRVLIKKPSILTLKFLKNSQVLADPIALALISPPLALSTKMEELVAFKTSLPHQKSQIKNKKAMNTINT
jgi:hypothetical protein